MSDPFRSVQVKNRTDERVAPSYDGLEVVWEPHEIRAMPAPVAEHCVRHSLYQWDPITDEQRHKLVILGRGQDESDLAPGVTHVVELLDRTHMDPTGFDSDGNPCGLEVKDLGTPLAMMRGRGSAHPVVSTGNAAIDAAQHREADRAREADANALRDLDAAHDKLAVVAVEFGLPE
jgi:hypothetical protein